MRFLLLFGIGVLLACAGCTAGPYAAMRDKGKYGPPGVVYPGWPTPYDRFDFVPGLYGLNAKTGIPFLHGG